MLRWAMILLVLTIIAAAFGFGGVISTAATIAQILFFVLLILFLCSLVLGLTVVQKK